MNVYLRRVNWVMCPLFFVATVVQLNDPDPARWMAIYGVAFALCVTLVVRGRVPIAAPALVAAVAIGWGLAIMLGGPVAAQYSHMFDAWKMTSASVEEAREATGVLIVGGWMAVIAMAQRRGGK